MEFTKILRFSLKWNKRQFVTTCSIFLIGGILISMIAQARRTFLKRSDFILFRKERALFLSRTATMNKEDIIFSETTCCRSSDHTKNKHSLRRNSRKISGINPSFCRAINPLEKDATLTRSVFLPKYILPSGRKNVIQHNKI